jgi:hypothetical protein
MHQGSLETDLLIGLFRQVYDVRAPVRERCVKKNDMSLKGIPSAVRGLAKMLCQACFGVSRY